MASRIRDALVGETALGVVAVGYVGGKEGLRLVTYPDIIGVWTGCYGETKRMHKGMKFTKGQCDSRGEQLSFRSANHRPAGHEERSRQSLSRPSPVILCLTLLRSPPVFRLAGFFCFNRQMGEARASQPEDTTSLYSPICQNAKYWRSD